MAQIAVGIKAFFLVSLCSGATASSKNRDLQEFIAIASYQPRTDVSNQKNIALDQYELSSFLGNPANDDLEAAKAIYERGAFVTPIARLTLTNESGLPTMITSDETLVTGKTANGTEVTGIAYESFNPGEMEISVQYASDAPDSCEVGGLLEPYMHGCFAADGELDIEGERVAYRYDPSTDNYNGRTLQQFSTGASFTFRDPNAGTEYFDEFEKFFDYYGKASYADILIQAAFNKTNTGFRNGNLDFSTYLDGDGQNAAIATATAYMILGMEIIGKLEHAVVQCDLPCETDDCKLDPVHSLDEAVAFWTGVLEDFDQGSGRSNLLYGLADETCRQFRTCGVTGDSTEGTSRVNIDLFQLFRTMQEQLLGNQCIEARASKDRMIPLMFLPLIQATLSNVFLAKSMSFDEVVDGEGAVLAAALLPRLASCNFEDAQRLYLQMRVGQHGVAGYSEVRQALERNYECLGVTCADVGGLYDRDRGEYEAEGAPCGGVAQGGGGTNPGLAVGLFLGGMVAVLLGFVLIRHRRRNKSLGAAEFAVEGDHVIA